MFYGKYVMDCLGPVNSDVYKKGGKRTLEPNLVHKYIFHNLTSSLLKLSLKNIH